MFVGFQQQPQLLNDRDSAGAELAFGVAFTDDHFGADDTRRGENIDDFQAARFGNAAGGVQTNPKESAVVIALQTFVEQEFDFLLREYLSLPVSLYFHAWCILDPIPQSLPQILHYCIALGVFLINAVALLRSPIARR